VRGGKGEGGGSVSRPPCLFEPLLPFATLRVCCCEGEVEEMVTEVRGGVWEGRIRRFFTQSVRSPIIPVSRRGPGFLPDPECDGGRKEKRREEREGKKKDDI